MKNYLIIFLLLSSLWACKKKDTTTSYIKFDLKGSSYEYKYDYDYTSSGPGAYMYAKSAPSSGSDPINLSWSIYNTSVSVFIHGKHYASNGYNSDSSKWIHSNFISDFQSIDTYRYLTGNFSGDVFLAHDDTISGSPIPMINGFCKAATY